MPFQPCDTVFDHLNFVAISTSKIVADVLRCEVEVAEDLVLELIHLLIQPIHSGIEAIYFGTDLAFKESQIFLGCRCIVIIHHGIATLSLPSVAGNRQEGSPDAGQNGVIPPL